MLLFFHFLCDESQLVFFFPAYFLRCVYCSQNPPPMDNSLVCFLGCLRVVQQVAVMSAVTKWMWHTRTCARVCLIRCGRHRPVMLCDYTPRGFVLPLRKSCAAWRGWAGESLHSPTSLYIYWPIYSVCSLEWEQQNPRLAIFLWLTMQPNKRGALIGSLNEPI